MSVDRPLVRVGLLWAFRNVREARLSKDEL